MSTDDVVTRDLGGIITHAEEILDATPEVELDDAPFSQEGERYQQVGTLGEGGMGEIRLVKDTRIARQVAVKVLRRQLSDQPEFRSRFLLEARLQGQLEHPSIVPVHDLGENERGELFFSMKQVRGVTLREALRLVKRGDRQPKFSRRRLLAAFTNVCLTVDFAHARGVVHRDLKPDNVMLGDFGEVYVLDWGIAKVIGRIETPISFSVELPMGSETPTRAGSVLGTPHYMAPERREGHADARSDVYSLGVILSEILEAERGTDVPPELAAIAERASAQLAMRRFTTARELHDALEKFLDGDRDLELRRSQAEGHARAAEAALDRATTIVEARSEAGREIGRAIGLDPTNQRALRTLMRMLTDVPAVLPPEAQAEAERNWRERRFRTLRMGTWLSMSVVIFAPFILWMGVRDAGLFVVWLLLTLASGLTQWFAARTERNAPFVLSLIFMFGGLAVLTTSMGLMGVVPGGFACGMMAWRMTIKRSIHGVLLILGASFAMCAPFILMRLGMMAPTYEVHDDLLIIHAAMHHFPPAATLVSLLVGLWGALAASMLFGRIYQTEILRAEQRLTFHAWQLKQLVL